MPVGWLHARRLERTLQKELPQTHLLAGRNPRALAILEDQDDVLYALPDGQVALVHLTYSAPTGDPRWPQTTLYATLDAFITDVARDYSAEAALARSHALAEAARGAQCQHCGADWAKAQFSEGCSTCGGWPLARPCPLCDGACGQVWDRAIQDSQDLAEAHWIGSCAVPQDSGLR